MLKLLKIELFKIFKRPRTYIAFGAITAIVLLIQVAVKFDGKSYVDLLLNNLKDSFEFNDEFKFKLLNGYLICFAILNTLLVSMPLLVALIAGDSIAGEANMGTLRLSLTKPISRTEYMIVKFAASVIYTMALLLWLALLALFGSMLIFGTNDLVVLRSDGIEQMKSFDVLWRYFAAFGYAAVALTTVSSLAFLLSVFAENSIGPIIATMSIVIVFTILSEMNIPIYNDTIKPYLFTTHMVAWKGFFYVQADAEGTTINGSMENLPAVMRSLSILLVYIGLFFGTAVWVFRKKDILT
ncbi:MAG: ABC transporter permease subunit [Chitinophagaceae bacterium]|nr:ABC transporter permease subunit [Chitinophagaceae bacterium]MBK9569587.1 ABC transporter permease subunit [Chitinophagaceae bacterium]MBL0132287.1 ABC transporter permease subunit [Chitinophagaceae bacterium]MBL0271689.1 ABC transporter permease subunit [Chitinophagaceae bacterium]